MTAYTDFHGQDGIDRFIAEVVLHERSAPGVFVDVGAAHPIVDSNSYHFERNGWRVLCIEPNPMYAEQLRKDRAEVYEVAVSDHDADSEVLTVYHLNTAPAYCQNAVTSLSPDPRLVAAHKELTIGVAGLPVRVTTLNTLLRDAGVEQVDVLSIDTEGTELDVLMGLDLCHYRPELIIVENVYGDRAVSAYLTGKRYHKFHRVGVNDLYAPEGTVYYAPL